MNRYPKVVFLYSLLKPYRLIVLSIIGFSVLASGFDGISIGLLVPLLSNLQQMEDTEGLPEIFQWLLNVFSGYSGDGQILAVISLVIGAIVLKNLFMTLSIRLGYWLSSRAVADLRESIVRLLMRVSIDYHHRTSPGELIEKTINNTSKVDFLLRMAIEFFANALTLLVLFSMLFLLSWELTLLTFAIGSVFIGLIVYYTRTFRAIGEASASSERGLMRVIHEVLGGIAIIKSYSQEAAQGDQLIDNVNAVRQAEFKRNFRVFSLNPLTDIVASLAIAVLFWGAMHMYDMNTPLMLAEMLPFVYILLRMVPLVKHLNSQRGEINSRWSYVGLVYDLLQEHDKTILPDGNKTYRKLQEEIRLRNVGFHYDAEKPDILKNVNVVFPAGKTTAIVGDSGSGKSTIVGLLQRLYDPCQGEITIDGQSLSNFQIATYHARIGIVSQDTYLFNNSVNYNIAFGLEERPSDDAVIAAAKKAGAHEFIMEMPDGYETMIGERGVQLSGGQRQRLAIARAIIRDPEILILDEATSSLDTVTEQRIHKAIRELSAGRTVIIIAHRLSTIQGADQIIVMKNGRVAEAGNAEKLLANAGEFYKLASADENVV